MLYEFATKDDKKPDPTDVPTHVSLGGTEYKVVDGCVDAPARYQNDLVNHGFRPRQRDKIRVDTPTKDAGEGGRPPQANQPQSSSPARR